MKKTNEIAVRRKGVLFASAGLAAMALTTVAAPAMAQDSANTAEPADNIDSSTLEPDTLDDTGNAILVTGTRIRNPAIENLEPTTSLDDEYLDQRAFINVADAINELPGIRGSVTPNEGQGENGAGVNFINIFGLGTNRTLTLVNGRRVVSSNSPAVASNALAGTQVDVNIIPTALVDRIDVVSIGGAPVYGSDAIAGTVNFILKDDFEGLELTATGGITDEGDNETYRFEGVYGTNFADGRGNLVLSGFYSNTEGVLSNDRDFLLRNIASCQNTANFDSSVFLNQNVGFNEGPGDGNPNFLLCPNFNVSNVNRNGVVNFSGAASFFDPELRAQNLVFQPDGTLRPYEVGIQNRSFFEVGGDGFQFSDFEQITSDLERLSFSTYMNYDLTDNITAFAEGQYFESVATELVEQPGFNSLLLGGRLGALTFSINNPLLTEQARNTLIAAGVDPVDGTFTTERVNLDIANTSANTEQEFIRGVVGVRGEFGGLFDNIWNFEASFNYGRSKLTDFQQDIDLQNFTNAAAACRTDLPFEVFPTSGLSPQEDPNCVPLSLFGENTASDAAIDYVTANNTNTSVLKQYVANVNFGGDLFALFSDPLSFNLGYEFRREEADFQPSEFEQSGRGLEAPTVPVSGGFSVHEVFGELFVPIISSADDFFIDSFDIFGRGRYVENDIAGGFFAWTAGAALSPIPDITFRGNFTRSFRAPAVAELFSPQSVGRDFVSDFCQPGSIDSGAVPAIRRRNCDAFLGVFPNGTPLLANNAAVPILQGGNPDLQNEKADSFTFGVVLQPRTLGNLSIAVDYVDISLSDPIVELDTGDIAAGCFDNENFDLSDPANGNQFCSLIRRDANGQVIIDTLNPGVTTGFVNGAFFEYEGIEAKANYSTGLDRFGLPGSLAMRGDLSYVRRRITSSTGVNPQRSDGILGDPQFAGQFAMQYDQGTFGLGTVVNYTGEQLASRFNRGPSPNDTREFDQYDDFVVVDVNAFVRFADHFRLTGVVRNLFNRQGQEYFGDLIPATVFDGLGDALGRRYTLSLTAEF